jgi:hypothetical protein
MLQTHARCGVRCGAPLRQSDAVKTINPARYVYARAPPVCAQAVR